jgi:TP901-1 family phage major tail protein
MAQKGRSMAIQIADGASPSVYTTIGGMRTKSMTVNNETVDITTDDEAPWQTLLGDAGIRSCAMSGSGVFDDGAQVNSLEDLAFSGALQEFKMTFANGDHIDGYFAVTSFEYTGEHNGAQMFNASFASSGTIELNRA